MTAYVNVFTRGIGYSHWVIDLGFTVLPKHEIKRRLLSTMPKWFRKGKNVYSVRRNMRSKEYKSWIVHVSFR